MKAVDHSKPINQRAWLLAALAAALLALSFGAPLVVLIVQSLGDADGGGIWLADVLQSQGFWLAFARSLGLAASALILELPLGVWIALHVPRRGWGAGVLLVAMALPLLSPPGAAGVIWKAFAIDPSGPLNAAHAATNAVATWAVLLAMDAWRWVGLVALLVYFAQADVPERLLLAARIDGASGWQVFRHVRLPRMWRVLAIAALVRFADSLAAFADVLMLNGGGPGQATTLLSLELQRLSGPLAVGRAAAMGLIYVVAMLALARFAFVVFGRERGVVR